VNPRVQIIAIVGSFCIVLLVFSLIRRRKLREEYSFLWFGASIGLICVSLFRNALDVAARVVGVEYPPSVLLLGVIVLGFVLAMHYSMSLSHLHEQNKRLAQEVTLLRQRVESALDKVPPVPDGRGPLQRQELDRETNSQVAISV
jgi:hypothetical protein